MKQLCYLTGFIATLMCASSEAATKIVTNVNDFGPGSLRDAISDGTVDRIEFNIPGPGVHTITLATALPDITRPVIIDGYTQPRNDGSGLLASPNTLVDGDNALLLIELNGNNGNFNGLHFTGNGTNCTVRGLVLNRFAGFAAILIERGSNVVEGCFIGTDPTGTLARGNTGGVRTSNANGNRIGGTTPAARNLISGNGGVGVLIDSSSTNTVVQGNFIGTDATGTNALANAGDAILINNHSDSCVIGGTNAAARNIIAGNGNNFGINAANSSGPVIQGNFIGTDVSGTKLMSFGSAINTLNASSCLIGGITATPGTPPGNVIAGGVNGGVNLSASGHVVQGNLIGTDVTGTLDLGSGNAGIMLNGANNCTIGGTNSGATNVISGHALDGIIINAGNTNVIQGNRIGTDITGANPLGNGFSGINIQDRDNSIIGNSIAFNSGDGVNVNSERATNNLISANSVFANGDLGIDLGNPGPESSNTAGDADEGPNHLQNFPVITNVFTGGGNVTITGFLPSTPNTTFRLEFFANALCTDNGFGQGQQFLGAANVTTAANGTNGFSVTFTGVTPVGPFITVTATDPSNNTSEFSARFPSAPCVPVVACALAPALATNAVNTTHTVTVTVLRDLAPVAGTIVNFRVTSGPNANTIGSDTTDASGHAAFTYTGNATPGTDSIQATGTVSGVSFNCGASKTWTVINTPPALQCPANITTNNAPGQCSRSLAFNVTATGTPAPVVVCVTNETNISSPHTFPRGTTRVDCTAANGVGVTNCSFTVTVNDTEPPTLTCPANIVTNVPPGVPNAVVNFFVPAVENCRDNGSAPVCAPPSGSSFPIGTTTVTCTETDTSGNSDNCSFTVTVNGAGCNLLVTTVNDSGPGSLREAINCANSTPGQDTITFNIPGTGVHTISLASALPQITNSVIIDGYTQPGAMPNTLPNGDNAVLLIELSGSGTNFSGFSFTGAGTNCTVRGLVINRFFNAVSFAYGLPTIANNVVEGCFLGTDAIGMIARSNAVGVHMRTSSGNRIGGNNPAARNIISASTAAGIQMILVASNNVVQGNLIGTDATGTNALANGNTGISIEQVSDNCVIGGTNTAARNVIAGNGSGEGIHCEGSSGHRIQGNFIGTDVTGTKPLGFSTAVFLSSSSSLIGGLTPTPGTPPGNLIAASALNNIKIGLEGTSPIPTGDLIQGNLIGTDATGTLDLGSSFNGIALSPALNCTIGGTNAGAANVISGNNQHGIFLEAGRSNVIQGNLIGTDITGGNPLGNAGNGVKSEGISDNLIGPANVIGFNGGDGINVEFANAINNRISANSIFANGGLGINLVGGLELPSIGMVTTNDVGDADIGPNRLQNFPVITGFAFSGGNVTLSGTLNSSTNAVFRLEFFGNNTCDASGFGEGQTFLGFTNVMTDSSGNGAFAATFTNVSGIAFTATATDAQGNTSEFSPCFALPCRINCPFGIGVPAAPNQCGATVNYDLPGAPGGCGPVTCSPPSGSFYPVGSTTVRCAATDAFGRTNICTFPVTVMDARLPVISGCQDLTAVAAPGEFGANVNFTATASHPCDGTLPVTCNPPAGFFALGQTLVTCEAADSIGRRSTCTFSVTVTPPPAVGICTFGQGFYGNDKARFNGLTSFTIVSNLLTQGPLVVGKTGVSSLSIQPGDTVLLELRLPAGGAPATLPNNGDQTLQTATLPLNNKGRFVNGFLGHTITLSLNARSSPALLGFGLSSNFCTAGTMAGADGVKGSADDVLLTNDVQSFSIASAVLSALADAGLGINNSTVQGLLELANRSLAAQQTGIASLSDIKDAVEAINRAFDDCRVLVNCATGTIVPDSFNDILTNAPVLNGAGGGGGSGSTNTLVRPPPISSLNHQKRTSNINAGKQPGEPNHAGNPGGKSVWWTWHAPRSGPVRIQTAGSSFDTLLAVYTGTAISNLALVASNDDTNGLLTSEVAFSAQAGTNYQIVVDGFDGASGSIVFTIIVDPPRLCLPLTVVGNQVQMCIAGEIGRNYTVEASPDLLNWTLIAAPLNSDGTLRFADPARDNYRRRYYRVAFEP